MSKGFTESERQVVTSLMETKAINFEAIGNMVAKHGAAATLAMDGEDVFCATMKRFVKVFRVREDIRDMDRLRDLGEVAPQIGR